MEAASRPKIIVVCGPTASGKTALAIALAKQLQATVWSADSRQCYRELNIGVARPGAQELAQLPHGFVATHSITDQCDAARFAQLGHQWIQAQHAQQKPTVVCGGTGLYLQALTEGLHQMPPTNLALRQELNEAYQAKGLAWLQQRVEEEDPDWFAQGEIQNPARLLRALEVKRGTGKSLVQWWQPPPQPPRYDCLWLGIDLPKEMLHERIGQRSHWMLQNGLLEEARAVQSFAYLPALQTVGYKECFAALEGRLAIEKLAEEIVLRTRQYAKRQLTWFRRLPQVHWQSEPSVDAALRLCSSFLRQHHL